MNNWLQLIGLAMKAGKVVSGEERVLKEIKGKNAQLVILTLDVANHTEKRIIDKCKTYQVPILRYGTRQELGNAIGKGERVVLAVTDVGFSHSIQTLVK